METTNVVTERTSAAYPLARKVAKAAGFSLAGLSGVYAVLSYYSSVAALRAAVEANKLTLLLYCDSNNSTGDACDQVRHDISPGQAVADVFGDEPDGGFDETQTQTLQTLQTRSLAASTTVPSSALNAHGGKTAPSSPTRTVAGIVEPTTLVTSIVVVLPDASITSWPPESGIGAASSTTAHASFLGGHPQPFGNDRGHRSWSSRDVLEDDRFSWHTKCETSWHTKCETFHQQAERAQQQMSVIPCTRDPIKPRAVVNALPTSELSDTCDILRDQYMQARRALKFWSCPQELISSPTTGHLLESTHKPQVSVVDDGKLFDIDWRASGKVNWGRAGALLTGISMGYLVCVLYNMRRKRKMSKGQGREDEQAGSGRTKNLEFGS